SSRFLPSEAYGGSFPTTPIPGCMSYWISWALITGCTHGLQVRVSSERLEGRRLKKPTDSTGQGCEMVVVRRCRSSVTELFIENSIDTACCPLDDARALEGVGQQWVSGAR